MKRSPLAIASLLLVLSATACGDERDNEPDSASEPATTEPTTEPTTGPTTEATDPETTSSGTAASAPPTPGANGPVVTKGSVTVLDSGDGPQICNGISSSPEPTCDGTPISGWEWPASAKLQEAGGTRWGDFMLTGTFDGTTFTVTSTEPPPEITDNSHDHAVEPATPSPCEPPADGWAVVDETRLGGAAMDATFRKAQRLPAYGGAWRQVAQGVRGGIINVLVTDDVAGAEAKLRETWGGALCVAETEYTADELSDIAAELETVLHADWASGYAGLVDVSVIYDDGSIQQWVDEKYGDGLVRITSTLTPIG